MLAEKTGASDLHKTMVSGLAGGIGLCGGGCGALGASVWLLSLHEVQEKSAKDLWNSKEFNSKVEEMIEVFLKASDHEFECKDIVKKQFETIEDHSNHLKEGGCSKNIEALEKFVKQFTEE